MYISDKVHCAMCGSADKNIVPHKKLGEFPVELNKNCCVLSVNTKAEKITSHQDESVGNP